MSSVDRPDSGRISERARAAISYAEHEFQVFPLWWARDDGSCACGDADCTSVGKHPIGRVVPKGSKDATDDVEQVARWWHQYPDANIGIATGSGLVVLDADIKPDADGRVHLQELLRWAGKEAVHTAISKTGSGGEHWLFRYDDSLEVGNRQGLRLSDGSRFPALDVRGDGGYIVAPPSNHESGGSYRWVREPDEIAQIPNNILAEIMREPSEESASIRRMQAVAREVDDAELRRIYDALSHIPADCDRDTWIRDVGMPLHDHFGGSDAGFHVWLAWSATADGLETPSGKKAFPGERALRKQWNSLKPHHNGRGLQSLFYRARMNGWKDLSAPTPILSMSGHTHIPPGEPEEEEVRQAFMRETRQDFPSHIIDSLRGPLSDIHTWALACNRRPDPVVALGSSLAIVAASIGRRIVGPTDAAASTAIAVLAPSGAGKDKALECVVNFLDAVPELDSGVMEDAPHHRVQLDGALLKHRGQLALLLDEYGAALKKWMDPKNSGDTLSPQIRKLVGHGRKVYQLWPGSPENATVKHHGLDKWEAGVFQPSFCLFGFATPGQFFRGLTADSLSNGFLGRHILLCTREDCVPDLRRITHGDTAEPPTSAVMWARTLAEVPVPRVVRRKVAEGLKVNGKPVEERLDDLAPSDPLRLPWGDGAEELFFEMAKEVDDVANEHLEDKSEDGAAVYRRLSGQAAVVALLLAVGESSNPAKAVIRETDVHRAFTLVKWAADFVVERILDFGAVPMDIQDAYESLTTSIQRANKKGKPYYRSRMIHTKSFIPYIDRLWKLVVEDPRFVADTTKATLREAPPTRG